MKIMVIHGHYPPKELKARQKGVLEAASSGTKIEFAEIKQDVFKLTHDADNELLSMLAGPPMVEKTKEAQKRGFDAVLPYGALDYGVDSARCHVDIPVVGMGRSGFCIAANLANRISVLVYQSRMIPNTWKFAREIGLINFIASVRAVDMTPSDMKARSHELEDRIIDLSKQAISQEGAEVVVVRGVSIVPVHCSAVNLSRKIGIPVIDCVAAGVKMAETMVSLRLQNSRRAYPQC